MFSLPDWSWDRGWCNLILNQIIGPISGLSDMILLLLWEREKKTNMAPGFDVCFAPGQQVCFCMLKYFLFHMTLTSCSLFPLLAWFFFSLSNNEISGKDLRAVGCMLPEQPLRPIYLSSSWGIEPAYLLEEKAKKKATSVIYISPHYPDSPSSSKPFSPFFWPPAPMWDHWSRGCNFNFDLLKGILTAWVICWTGFQR